MMGTCNWGCRTGEDCDRSCEDGPLVPVEETRDARYRWQGEDSTFEGVIVARYTKRSGKSMVVLEDDRGLNHIYPDNPKRLVLIDAKLSPAPVGDCKCLLPHATHYRGLVQGPSIRCCDNCGLPVAPTPPAKDTGETTAAWRTNLLILTTQAEEDRQELDGSHCRDCADENGRCPSNLVACDPMQALAEAHPPRLLALLRDFADLEARLAEAVTEKVAHFTERVHAQCERDEARRALADATKRIEALERGLSEIRSLTQDDERSMRAVLNHIYDEADALLSPASEGKP